MGRGKQTNLLSGPRKEFQRSKPKTQQVRITVTYHGDEFGLSAWEQSESYHNWRVALDGTERASFLRWHDARIAARLLAREEGLSPQVIEVTTLAGNKFRL